MTLRPIELTIPLDEALPQELESWLCAARTRIEEYWDQFHRRPLPQYVECDFEYVARAIRECQRRDLIDGKLFVEWGCGFAVVTGIAAILGLDAVGIEAESFLTSQALRLFKRQGIAADVWHGNFLPGGARELADDTDPLVSLTHANRPAYDMQDMALADFAFVFAYPWPGEEHFLRLVFDRFARCGALLLMYRGPYHVELYRKRQ